MEEAADVLQVETPLGVMELEAREGALVRAVFTDKPLEEEKAGLEGRAPVLLEARAWIGRYFKGRDPGPAPRLMPVGTAFQKTVWRELALVPWGRQTTYGEMAKAVARTLGRPAMSARAVGAAMGANQILLFLPCHRVIGANGRLTGFGAGMDRKAALLALEGFLFAKS